MTGDERRAKLAEARLYLCTGIRDGGEDLERFLDAVLSSGVDILQLREKQAQIDEIREAAKVFRRLTDEHAALFVMNDDPNLAASTRADGVHLGQEDMTPEEAREILSKEFLIGRSTHEPQELDQALTEPIDYLGVGPVYETPTKLGRKGVGLDYVSYAAAHATKPFFVTGGMTTGTIPEVLKAGATRVVVVRALTEAADPGAVAAGLRALLP